MLRKIEELVSPTPTLVGLMHNSTATKEAINCPNNASKKSIEDIFDDPETEKIVKVFLFLSFVTIHE